MIAWQVSARDLEDLLWDVAIVGCGPAGAMAALCLAKQGRRVVALEQHAFSRDKVCGDGLMPDAIRVLARHRLADLVRARSFEAHRLVLYSPSRVEVPLALDALVLKRFDLDAILGHAASDAGATVAHGRVEAVDVNADRVSLTVRGKDHQVRARILVLATGANTHLLASVGMLTRKLASGVAVRHYVRSSAVVDELVVSFERSLAPGYAWIFPLGNGEYNVGCGVVYQKRRKVPDLNRVLQRFMRECPPARRIATAKLFESRVAGAVLRSGLEGASFARTPNVLAIGETIGCTLPVSGEGIGKAMETGEIAAAAIDQFLDHSNGSLTENYQDRISLLQRRYAGYGTAQSWLARPWLADFVAVMARRSPQARKSFSQILDETADPRTIFSASGLWQMLTR